MKYTEWQNNLGWLTGDVSDLGKGSNYWWYPARMLEIPIEDFLLLLKKYNVSKVYYNKDANVLIYSWDNYSDCHKFTLFINAEAKKRNFVIC